MIIIISSSSIRIIRIAIIIIISSSIRIIRIAIIIIISSSSSNSSSRKRRSLCLERLVYENWVKEALF